AGRLCSIVAEPDDPGVLGGGIRGQLGPVVGAIVARRLPDQRAWLCTKLDRVPGSAAGRRHRARDARGRLVFATPALARLLEQTGARHPRWVERRPRRRCAGATAV